jgi:hypothetical protein
MDETLYAAIGFVGVAIVIGAYFANQRGWLGSADWRFPCANLIGSCLILVSLYARFNLPAFAVNLCWGLISLHGLIKSARAPTRRPTGEER